MQMENFNKLTRDQQIEQIFNELFNPVSNFIFLMSDKGNKEDQSSTSDYETNSQATKDDIIRGLEIDLMRKDEEIKVHEYYRSELAAKVYELENKLSKEGKQYESRIQDLESALEDVLRENDKLEALLAISLEAKGYKGDCGSGVTSSDTVTVTSSDAHYYSTLGELFDNMIKTLSSR